MGYRCHFFIDWVISNIYKMNKSINVHTQTLGWNINTLYFKISKWWEIDIRAKNISHYSRIREVWDRRLFYCSSNISVKRSTPIIFYCFFHAIHVRQSIHLSWILLLCQMGMAFPRLLFTLAGWVTHSPTSEIHNAPLLIFTWKKAYTATRQLNSFSFLQ